MDPEIKITAVDINSDPNELAKWQHSVDLAAVIPDMSRFSLVSQRRQQQEAQKHKKQIKVLYNYETLIKNFTFYIDTGKLEQPIKEYIEEQIFKYNDATKFYVNPDNIIISYDYQKYNVVSGKIQEATKSFDFDFFVSQDKQVYLQNHVVPEIPITIIYNNQESTYNIILNNNYIKKNKIAEINKAVLDEINDLQQKYKIFIAEEIAQIPEQP